MLFCLWDMFAVEMRFENSTMLSAVLINLIEQHCVYNSVCFIFLGTYMFTSENI